MQLFPCPFCGLRDEAEFHYAGEPKARPEPAGSVSDADWADYLFARRNPKGRSEEVWLHLTCGELFLMERDTLTHEVVSTRSLARSGP